jgi:hypothetical protein
VAPRPRWAYTHGLERAHPIPLPLFFDAVPAPLVSAAGVVRHPPDFSAIMGRPLEAYTLLRGSIRPHLRRYT